MKILVLNGPNINMIGIREPELYGKDTYRDLCELIKHHAKEKKVHVDIYQSNIEGDLISKIQKARGKYAGLILNLGGYTHTSIALRDALLAVQLPFAEVHLTDPDQREPYRHINFVKDLAAVRMVGKGIYGYVLCLDELVKHIGE